MKIDLRKAYDMVEWSFIEDMLVGYKFPPKFVQMIMICVTPTRFSVKVNGDNRGYFKGKRGLRQGDPISPLLFVLVIEVFSRIMTRMSKVPDFRYHPMCKKQNLTHLTLQMT